MIRRRFGNFWPRWEQGALILALQAAGVGCLTATLLFSWCQQLIGLLGTSLPVVTAMMWCVAIGMAAGGSRWSGRLLSQARPSVRQATWYFALAGCAVGYPWWMGVAGWFLELPAAWGLTAVGWTQAVACASVACLLGLPAFIAARLIREMYEQSPADDRDPLPLQEVFLGGALGCIVCGFVLAPWLGVFITTLVAATACAALAVWQLFRTDESVATQTDVQSAADTSDSEAPAAPITTVWIHPAAEGAIAVGLGGMLAVALRMLHQLFPVTAFTVWSEAAALFVGLGMGLSWMIWRRNRHVSKTIAALATAARASQKTAPTRQLTEMNPAAVKFAICSATAAWIVATLIFGFPLLVRASLWLNSYGEWWSLLSGGRFLIAAAALIPLGFTVAICFALRVRDRIQRARGSVTASPHNKGRDAQGKLPAWQPALLAAVIGFGLVTWNLLPRFGAATTLIVAAWWLVASAAIRWFHWELMAKNWRGASTTIASVGLLAAGPFFVSQYDPLVSAKTLFATQVFLAYRADFDFSLLPYLDEGRAVAVHEAERGTLTVWQHGGQQFQIRENGIPKGAVSIDAGVFPQFAGELVQVVYPLVLHEKPQRMLMLGLGSSEPLAAGLTFPVQQIVCAEGDVGLVRAIDEAFTTEGATNPLADDRVTWVRADPPLALAADRDEYDVIVSLADQPALLRSQAGLTVEFYRRAARRLSAGGIFCQRIQSADLGPEPLRHLARTLQTVFVEVMAVEFAPGETLFLATNDARGLVRPELMSRLQTRHVRQLLAQLGLDWSVLLNLPSISHDHLEQFAAEKSPRVNTAAGSRLAFALPREVMRWGLKQEEMQTALAERTGRLLDWIGSDAESPDLLRRLAEVRGQQDLLVKYSDQYWAYRTSVREQITSRSGSPIQQVSGGGTRGGLHPEDRRRLKYFTTLGEAVKSLAPADIERVAAFEEPYDPLLSYFVHQEVAELYARSPSPDRAIELRHRLHAVYYASPQDRSVRAVLDTLKLLREHPEAEPSAMRRWDDLNALLQALQSRWEARSGVPPTKTSTVISEIDATLIAAEKTLETLDTLTVDAGIPAEDWSARRKVLERTLIRPVQAYRATILSLPRRVVPREAASEEQPAAESNSQE